MKSEIIKHLRLYRNGSSRLDFILDCHDEIIELKRNNRIISQRIKQLEKYPVHNACVPQLTHNLVMLHGQNDANDLIERLKNKQNENGLKILKLRKLL
jgi:hypothetical protein